MTGKPTTGVSTLFSKGRVHLGNLADLRLLLKYLCSGNISLQQVRCIAAIAIRMAVPESAYPVCSLLPAAAASSDQRSVKPVEIVLRSKPKVLNFCSTQCIGDANTKDILRKFSEVVVKTTGRPIFGVRRRECEAGGSSRPTLVIKIVNS